MVLAFATMAMAVATYQQLGLTRYALDLNIRPLLADATVTDNDQRTELLQFGAPARQTVTVKWGTFYHHKLDGIGSLYLSVAFQNIGSGVAAIQSAGMEPSVGEIKISRKFVPVGDMVRVNISILGGLKTTQRFASDWWATEGIEVWIRYTDARGRQTLMSRAAIRQYVTQGPFVQEISVHEGGGKGSTVTGRGTY